MKYGKLLLVAGIAATALSANAQWPAIFHGNSTTNTYDSPNAIALDSLGNVIVVGCSTNTKTEADYGIVKYNRNGAELWRKKIDRLTGFQTALKVAADSDDNIIVTGFTSDSGSNSEDILTVKLDTNGNLVWSDRYDGTAHLSDIPNALHVSTSGDVFVAGYTQRAGVSDHDFVTIKISADGVRQWAKTYSAGTNEDDAVGVATDFFGNSYVVGKAFFNDTRTDWVTIKYDLNGVKQWAKRYNGSSDSDDMPVGVRVVNNTTIIVAGTSIENAFSNGYTAVRYDQNGAKTWTCKINTVNQEENATAMTTDEEGNTYITGTSGNDYELLDYCTVKISANGVKQWSKTYTAHHIIGGSTDLANSVDVDNSGNVYVSGTTQGDGVNFDFNVTAVKYGPDGSFRWAKVYAGAGEHIDDFGRAMVVDKARNRAYVTCEVPDGTHNYDYLTTLFK